jgi:hypothetical protein
MRKYKYSFLEGEPVGETVIWMKKEQIKDIIK